MAQDDGHSGRDCARIDIELAGVGAVRAMSENGEYVFFDSQAALVPQATNDTLDTYEWHEDRQTGEDTISLIGSGTSPAPTFFLGYSPYYTPSGRKVEAGNVFIGTHAKLSPQDTNSVGNIYDARICEAESPCMGEQWATALARTSC